MFALQLPNRSLVLAACAACIGGTFQFGYNISVINAPTTVITHHIYCSIYTHLSVLLLNGLLCHFNSF